MKTNITSITTLLETECACNDPAIDALAEYIGTLREALAVIALIAAEAALMPFPVGDER